MGKPVKAELVSDLDECKALCNATPECKQLYMSNLNVDSKYPCAMFDASKNTASTTVGGFGGLWERFCVRNDAVGILRDESTSQSTQTRPPRSIEIMEILTGESMTGKEPESKNTMLWIWLGVGVGIFILALIILGFIYKRRNIKSLKK
jgi:hypothetical protein